MKIAITGGTGFVGRHLARALAMEGHEVLLIARGVDHRDDTVRHLERIGMAAIGTDDEEKLCEAMRGCDAVAHCAGINREIGSQTYERVHVQGTRNVVNAARRAEVKKIVLLSFLRARPGCGSPYHESKWAAEEIVRGSGLDYTILKAGMIYGKGDHMLDHLTHAFYTFPIFCLVGFREKAARPAAVEDVVRILEAALAGGRLSRETVYVLGPEELPLGAAVRRVAGVVGKRPLFFPMPVWFHHGLAWVCERVMKVPLVALAQVRILAEGLDWESAPETNLPEDLIPKTMFSEEQIRKGLPEMQAFGWEDLRNPCCAA